MKDKTHWILIGVIVAAGATLLLLPRHQPPEPPSPVSSEKPPAPAATEPLVRFPVPKPEAQIPAAAPEPPLPALNASDAPLQEALGRLFDPKRLGELIIFKNLINRLVVTIDNLPRAKLPLRDLPAVPPPDKFLVKARGIGKAEIDPANYRRYAAYVQLFDAVDAGKLAALYFRFYPLFQQAYSDLGYKSAYFNDRLVEAIDDLLAAPEVKDPVPLVQPAVFYKYADPKLESLSAGQKLMIRIGSDNAEKVKTKLRELRQALTGHGTDG